MEIRKEEGWLCKNCDSLYESQEDAAICCADIKNVDIYYCPGCGDYHESEDEALSCCGEEE